MARSEIISASRSRAVAGYCHMTPVYLCLLLSNRNISISAWSGFSSARFLAYWMTFPALVKTRDTWTTVVAGMPSSCAICRQSVPRICWPFSCWFSQKILRVINEITLEYVDWELPWTRCYMTNRLLELDSAGSTLKLLQLMWCWLAAVHNRRQNGDTNCQHTTWLRHDRMTNKKAVQCYRKDDRAMRAIHCVQKKTPTHIFFHISMNYL